MNLPCQIKKRRESRQIMVGDVAIGGNAPISVQSMTNTDTCDVIAQIPMSAQVPSINVGVASAVARLFLSDSVDRIETVKLLHFKSL